MRRGHSTSNHSLADRLSGAFGLVAALISLTLLVSAVSFGLVLGHFEPTISSLLSGRTAVDQAHSGMIDEETGLRGFLATGDASFLQPFQAGVQEQSAGNAAAEWLTTRAELAAPILDMRLAQENWNTQWAVPAAATLPGTLTSTNRTAFFAAGKALFDRYRNRHSIVVQLLDGDIAAEQSAEHSAVALGLGMALAVLVLTTVVARRQHRSLRAALVAPIGDLLATMHRVREGDLAARPAGIGPPELREVAAELGEMTATMVAERARVVALEVAARSQADRLRLIVTVGREIAGSLSLRYVAEAVGAAAITISGCDAARIWLASDEPGELTLAYDTATSRDRQSHHVVAQLGDGLVGRAAQFGRPLSARASGAPPVEHRSELVVGALAVPMIVGARVVGILELTTGEPGPLDAGSLDIILSLAGQAATAVEAARLNQRADELSHTDALTRLPNRRRLDADLKTEVARSARYRRPLAFVMLDVDRFKLFNDTHGHQAGDEILAEFGTTMAGVLRETDTAYRFGGEEFCVLLRETDAPAAAAMAERLRATIADRFANAHGSEPVTASLGVAAMPGDASDADGLIAAADRALYAAKAAGRNCVVIAGSAPKPEAPRDAAPAPTVIALPF